MASMEERVSHLEGTYEHLATKADLAEVQGILRAEIAELRGELRSSLFSIRWIMAVIGIGLALLNVALRFLG